MTATETICLTILLCWQSLMAVIWWIARKAVNATKGQVQVVIGERRILVGEKAEEKK